MGLHTVWQLLFFLTCLFLLQFPHCFPDKTHLLQSSHPLHLTSDILTKHKKASGVVVVIWVCIEMELLRHKACIWMPSHPSQRHSDWIIEGGIWHTCTPDSVSKKAWVKNYGELFSVNVFLHFLFMMFLIDLFWVVAYLCIYLCIYPFNWTLCEMMTCNMGFICQIHLISKLLLDWNQYVSIGFKPFNSYWVFDKAKNSFSKVVVIKG